MRYQIRVVEPSLHRNHFDSAQAGQLLAEYHQHPAAMRYARKVAHDWHYGVVVVDTREERVDWGNGWESGPLEAEAAL